MEIDWSTPHPSVTAQIRAGIEANKATQNATDKAVRELADMDIQMCRDHHLMSWEREMASLPDDGVTYVVEGEEY